jgi:hypothetical protein
MGKVIVSTHPSNFSHLYPPRWGGCKILD